MKTYFALPGQSYPLGAAVTDAGVNFSIFSKNARSVELLLFDNPSDTDPIVIEFEPQKNKTFYYWHCLVPGIEAGQLYGYRVDGPYNPQVGHRYDRSKVLIDPYAKAIATEGYDRDAAKKLHFDNIGCCMKSVVVDTSSYDWNGDRHLMIPHSKSIIYELHVAGFTKNPNSGVQEDKRGTYAGLIQKIPHLKDLGITAVELMPVQQFDDQQAPAGLSNYWGYSPVAFFAPHSSYSFDKSPLGPVDEFRDMVKALHASGIEVILDVVFNHTAEADEKGPTLSLKGLQNYAYYILKDKLSKYENYSGCGNSINANFSIVRTMIIECLKYWVTQMHVDGFRFDLASVLCRGERGELLDNPPLLWSIESEPVLAGTKIIAEAWDAIGLYQLGKFIGSRFAEWNGRFRDDVRRFVKGDNGTPEIMSSRVVASPDIYTKPDREPYRSINFITCHDGFTLNDLVSFNEKHNEANLQNNSDGMTDNFSWNCGVEGGTDKPDVEKLRLRQIKNLLTILFTSQGTPMIQMGDEVRRTQKGNNNTYCQDNAMSWFDWDLVKTNSGLLRFVTMLNRIIRNCRIFQEERIISNAYSSTKPYISWHGVNIAKPDFSNDSHTLAFTLTHPGFGEKLHIILNAYWEALDFELPKLKSPLLWHRIIDTYLDSPDDFTEPEGSPAVNERFYRVQPRSSVILTALIG
jgi:isoamylase